MASPVPDRGGGDLLRSNPGPGLFTDYQHCLLQRLQD